MESTDAFPRFTISVAIPAELTLSPKQFLATRPHIERLMAGAMVFRIDPNLGSDALQTLLVRRAASDSYALKWEKPGGCVDHSDDSLVACAVRELFEETGLHASYILCPIGIADKPSDLALAGWGMAPEDERAEVRDGDECCLVELWESGKQWGVLNFIIEVAEDLTADDVVKIDPREHSEFAWVTEEEVREGKLKDGRSMQFTSEAVWRTLLDGFRQRQKC